MNDKNIFDDIKKYSSMGKLSVFVGAGVSRLSGFPSWAGLVQSMANEVGYTYEKDIKGNALFSSEELLKVPQIYFLNKGENDYRDRVEKGFANTCIPNEVHNLILSLHPNHILTTNYDTLIEETAVKFGRNFSALNSNNVVAKAETTNYIVKVHGDFSADFVLKEQDYLDYENNYILIDNIVKNIFATNLVIFVGYGLNDYNIKLILNWVKRIQSDSFVMPVFIHTGRKVNENELVYQNGRGLRILDCNQYTDSSVYSEKYISVLKQILMYNGDYSISEQCEKLQYMYSKIIGIKNLSYIRREEFKNIFKNEYELNDEWKIINKTKSFDAVLDECGEIKSISKNRLNYFEDFFDNKEKYEEINRIQYDQVKLFLEKSGVTGIENDREFKIPKIEISSPAFISDFVRMKEFCSKEYDKVEDNYKKAYFFAQLGKYADSYCLYTKVLIAAKQEEHWDIYYFSQINRQYLFSIIKHMIQLTTGLQGAINFGQTLKLFDDDFIDIINQEMAANRLENQFHELPYWFKMTYPTLEAFSDRNCYLIKYYDLTKNKFDIEKSLKKDTISLGVSIYDKTKLEMLDTTKFLYENMILFTGFYENKLYIKNALISWIEAYSNDIMKNKVGAFGVISNSRYKFTITDILLISKCFKKDDITYIENKIELSKLPFEKTAELETYVFDSISMYRTMFASTLVGSEIMLWKLYSEELKNLLRITPYFVNSNDCKLEVVDFVANIRDGHFDISDRIRIIDKWIGIAKVEGSSLIIENWLLEKITSILKNQIPPIGIDRAISDVSMIAQLLSDIIEVDKCSVDAISKLIIDNRDNLVSVKLCLEYVYQVLNDEAKQIVDSLCEIQDVFQLMRKYYSGNLPKDFNEFSIVEAYLNEKIREKQENEKKGIGKYSFLSEEEYIEKVAAYMFIRNFPHDITEKYCGIYAGYDFLLCPLKFKRDTFQLEWLFTYSDNLCEKLKQCKIQKQVIIECIEKAFCENLLNQWQTRRLFEIYKMMRD